MKRLVVMAALVACGSREPVHNDPDPAPKPRAPDDKARTVDDAKRGYIGVLTPRATNQVVSPLNAPIAEILVQVGDKVAKDQAVARFDPKTLQQQLKIEQSTLNARRAEVGKAVGAAAGARAAFVRDKKAFDQGVGSKADLDASQAHYQEASSEISNATANVDQQQNVIAKLKDSIKNTTLVAPMDGRVGFIAVHRGDRVEEGRPVMRIDSDGDSIVKFAIPGDEATRINKGDHVDIVLESEVKPLDGVVRLVTPDIDPVAQMILAEADISSPPANLRTGVRCRVRARVK